MFDDLEVMLGGATQAPKGPINVGGMKKLSKRGSNSQIVPMNDLDDLQDMYQFDSKRSKAAKAPVPQSIPPNAGRMAPNAVGLPPMGAKAPKHVLDAGMMDDIDRELEDEFTSNNQYRSKNQVPDITTNASPPRNGIKSPNSDLSDRNNNNRAAPETRDRPLPATDSNSFAPSSEQPTMIHGVDVAPAQNIDQRKPKRFEIADDGDDLDFLEQEINNFGAASANKVIADRSAAAKPT